VVNQQKPSSTPAVVRVPVAAVAFLTRVPVGRFVHVSGADVGRSAPLFPLVGGGVGALSGLVADALAGALPALAAGALAVALAALLTGALHLDALADSADALGGDSRARALEIMRDHAVGAFGATALILVIVLDAAVLGELGAGDDAALAGLAAGAAGRAAMLPLALALPYARPGEGQGRTLEEVGAWSAIAGLVVALLLALPAGAAGLAAAGAAGAVAAVLAVEYKRWLGGVTGDLLGAAAKLAETAALVTALAVLSK
jgi:adenosylcobinamide-GDP ribazoletransferase